MARFSWHDFTSKWRRGQSRASQVSSGMMRAMKVAQLLCAGSYAGAEAVGCSLASALAWPRGAVAAVCDHRNAGPAGGAAGTARACPRFRCARSPLRDRPTLLLAPGAAIA